VPAPWFILPLTLVSLGILFLSFSQNPETNTIQAEMAGWEGVSLLSAADYAEHIRFQRSFSYLPLKTEDRPNRPYHSYTLDSEGLIAGIADTPGVFGTVLAAEDYTDGVTGIPPFPLTELMTFLNTQAAKPLSQHLQVVQPRSKRSWTEGTQEVSDLSPKELFPSLLILALSLPLFLSGRHRHIKNGKLSIYIDKRIAA
jgi:hypothetical protein